MRCRNMDEELFKKLALSFEKASGYLYEFTVGRKHSKSIIITSVTADEFTHICGIDHLPDIKASINHKTQNKVSLF